MAYYAGLMAPDHAGSSSSAGKPSKGSILFPDTRNMKLQLGNPTPGRPSMSIVTGIVAEKAFDWATTAMSVAADPRRSGSPSPSVVVVNFANNVIRGGHWSTDEEYGPEEWLAVHSNLIEQLDKKVFGSALAPRHYPIPPFGAIYTPFVGELSLLSGSQALFMVFFPPQFRLSIPTELVPPSAVDTSMVQNLPVISVSPVRKPRTDKRRELFCNLGELNQTQDKMKAILRVAALHNHRDIVMGAFGDSRTFENPSTGCANLWGQLFCQDSEFAGKFDNIIFVIDKWARSGTYDAYQAELGKYWNNH